MVAVWKEGDGAESELGVWHEKNTDGAECCLPHVYVPCNIGFVTVCVEPIAPRCRNDVCQVAVPTYLLRY